MKKIIIALFLTLSYAYPFNTMHDLFYLPTPHIPGQTFLRQCISASNGLLKTTLVSSITLYAMGISVGYAAGYLYYKLKPDNNVNPLESGSKCRNYCKKGAEIGIGIGLATGTVIGGISLIALIASTLYPSTYA